MCPTPPASGTRSFSRLTCSIASAESMRMSAADTLSHLDFDAPRLFAELERFSLDPSAFDELEFGLIGMQLDGTVVIYNRLESEFSGIKAQRIMGLNFFTDVAPCTNNYLISGRFETEPELDETIDYVFTLKMRPTRVQLRLLKAEPSQHQFLVVRRR